MQASGVRVAVTASGANTSTAAAETLAEQPVVGSVTTTSPVYAAPGVPTG